MSEFGGKDDWVSKVLLKHYLASIIQARWRGYSVRKKWQDTVASMQEEQKLRRETAAAAAVMHHKKTK